MAGKLGLIAGKGRFPILTAENARREGYSVIAAAVRDETDPAIEKAADRVYWFSFTQLGKLIETFRQEGISRAVMAGLVGRRRIYAMDILRLDRVAAELWASLPDRRGETILKGIADVLSRNGIELLDSTLFMGPYLFSEGLLTGRKPTPEEMADVAFGWRMAKVIAEHDIGQSVAVKSLSVVAVEALEGTDKCILRAGELCGPGFVLVKVSKRGHDMRFDVPVVGERTIETMKKAGATVLAAEAAKTLMMDKDRFLEAAEGAGISVLGIGAGEAVGGS